MMTLISGGQTGADQGAIAAALKHGIPIEGWAPRGWLTEAGPDPRLKAWGLLATTTASYPERTRRNVAMADAVLIFGVESRGSELTKRLCRETTTPYLWMEQPHVQTVATWLAGWIADEPGSHRLMVAGNRESKNPGIGDAVFDLMDSVFSAVPR